MRRRDFITLAGTAAALPLTARAQQPKLPNVGFLGASSQVAWKEFTAGFTERMHELGWLEDRTVTITYRWAEGKDDNYAAFAAEFVRLNVNVIVTAGSAVPALKRATSVIPIVFAIANDPVAAGLVTSLSRPGGNVTGLSVQAPDLAGKRLELARQLRPSLRGLAIIANAGYPAAMVDMNEAEAAAKPLGLAVTRLEIHRAEDIAPAIDGLNGRADALYLCADALVNANHANINTLALRAGLLTLSPSRGYLDGGGVLSYGPNNVAQFRRAADFVDKILHGAKPADLPVEQPTQFELVINRKAATALGLTIPPNLFALADEVIE